MKMHTVCSPRLSRGSYFSASRGYRGGFIYDSTCASADSGIRLTQTPRVLDLMGLTYTVETPDVDEAFPGRPSETVMEISRRKAAAVAARLLFNHHRGRYARFLRTARSASRIRRKSEGDAAQPCPETGITSTPASRSLTRAAAVFSAMWIKRASILFP